MNKFLTGTLAIGLLLATAACGSDEKSSDTTTAAAETVVSTADTATDDTATDDSVTAETAAAGGTPQEQVLAQTITQLTGLGFEFDEDCLAEQIEQLSDEDAQKIVDAGDGGSPDVSPAAEAIGSALEGCVTPPTITS